MRAFTCTPELYPLFGAACSELLRIDNESRLIASGIVRKPQTNHTWHNQIDGFFSQTNVVKVKIESFRLLLVYL